MMIILTKIEFEFVVSVIILVIGGGGDLLSPLLSPFWHNNVLRLLFAINELIGKFDCLCLIIDKSLVAVNKRSVSFRSFVSGLVLGVELISADATSILIVGDCDPISNK
ncbi:hypothetical protein DERP_001602 [Dermatophagoides pteronyssinus]|uniref:Uncharacterized protein n=1 Tax=Dermatophagoides pteronyssinus TaxID=6956 RepID=A0ABQ8JBP9_DERPT|nr:hypothetical protein DERP_001602 [Dermatophagoides pteronyssinus]